MVLAGALLFVSGLAIGQRRTGKYDSDFNATPTGMSVKLLYVNVDSIYESLRGTEDIDIPDVGFDRDKGKFVATTFVSPTFTKKSIDYVRAALTWRTLQTVQSIKYMFPDVKDDEIELMFKRPTEGFPVFAEYKQGKLSLR